MRLAIATDVSWLLALGMTCVGVGLVVWFYRRYAEQIPRRYMRWLLLLRVLAVLLVMLFFVRPVLSWTRTEGRRRRVAMLVDTSKSMSVKDTPGLPERLERVKAALTDNDVLKRLASAFEVFMYGFDTELRRFADAGELRAAQPAGALTDLAGALGGLARDSEFAAVVCISDGNHNAAGEPAQAAGSLGRAVYTVGAGLPEGQAGAFKDIEVRDAVSAGRAVLNSRTSVAVRIEARGFAGLHTMALVKEAGSSRLVGQSPLVLDDVVGEQEIQVEFTPDKEGLLGLIAEVPVEEQEAIAENNRVRFVIDVARSALKVLYVEGVVGPEGKFLRRLLLKDPDVQAVALVRVGQNKYTSQGEVEGLTLRGLPDEKGLWARFDVFVLNNVPADVLGAGNVQALKSLLAGGKGLLLMPGEFSYGAGGYHASALAEALPVAFGDGAPMHGEFALAVPDNAPASPLSRMLRDAQAAGMLPAFEMLHAARSLPAAETLLAVTPRTGSQAGSPVLALGTYGKGRVAALLGGPTYLWRAALAVYNGFWGSMLRHLGGQEALELQKGTVALSLEKPEFALGEMVALKVRFRDDDGSLCDAATVEVLWKGPGGAGKALLTSAGAGEYSGSLTPPETGAYELAATATMAGKTWQSEVFKIEVRRIEAEFQKIGLDRDLLAAIAGGSGGVYLDLDRIGELPGMLEGALEVKKVTTVFNPAKSWLLYLLLVGLMSAEWYVRRRLELP